LPLQEHRHDIRGAHRLRHPLHGRLVQSRACTRRRLLRRAGLASPSITVHRRLGEQPSPRRPRDS
jgi:hypothetical protein